MQNNFHIKILPVLMASYKVQHHVFHKPYYDPLLIHHMPIDQRAKSCQIFLAALLYSFFFYNLYSFFRSSSSMIICIGRIVHFPFNASGCIIFPSVYWFNCHYQCKLLLIFFWLQIIVSLSNYICSLYFIGKNFILVPS
jgi:hypothetical protein